MAKDSQQDIQIKNRQESDLSSNGELNHLIVSFLTRREIVALGTPQKLQVESTQLEKNGSHEFYKASANWVTSAGTIVEIEHECSEVIAHSHCRLAFIRNFEGGQTRLVISKNLNTGNTKVRLHLTVAKKGQDTKEQGSSAVEITLYDESAVYGKRGSPGEITIQRFGNDNNRDTVGGNAASVNEELIAVFPKLRKLLTQATSQKHRHAIVQSIRHSIFF